MELIVHIGGHRTGSSALVKALQGNEKTLRAEGVEVWSPPQMWEMEPFTFRPKRDVDAPRREAARALVEGAGAERLVMSNENIIGGMRPNLTERSFYQDADRRLADFAAVLPKAPLRIGLGLRDYESWWLSAYVYTLVNRDLPPHQDLVRGWAAATRGWIDLVKDVRDAFPDSEIVVWTLEAAREDMREVAARMLGRTPDGLAPLEREVNPSFGPDAIPRLSAIRRNNPGIRSEDVRRRYAGRLKRQGVPKPFMPFTEDERAHMATRYATERAAFAEGFAGVRFLDIDAGGTLRETGAAA